MAAAALTVAGGVVSTGSSATTAHKLALRPQSDSTQYTLTVQTSFVGGIGIDPAEGSSSSSPAGIDCGTTCSAAFPAGTRVTLTPTPAAGAAGFYYGGGTNLGCHNTSRCVVTMNHDTTISAYFVPANAPTLWVSFDGSGSGTVTSSPAGIDCQWQVESCAVYVAPGTQVTLTETPDSGSSFAGWSAPAWTGQVLDCSGAGTTTNTCAVTVNNNTVVNASFQSNTPPPPPPPPPACVVPKVKGKTLMRAEKRITNHHCGVGRIRWVKSAPRYKNRVISQNPKAGTQLKNGAKVALKLGG